MIDIWRFKKLIPRSTRAVLVHLLRLWIGICLTLVCAGYTQAQTVLSTHPRLWLTPARLATLKGYAGRNGGQGTVRWQNLKSLADQAVSGAVSDNQELIPVLGLAYQVTGNTAYAQ